MEIAAKKKTKFEICLYLPLSQTGVLVAQLKYS